MRLRLERGMAAARDMSESNLEDSRAQKGPLVLKSVRGCEEIKCKSRAKIVQYGQF